MFIKNEKYKFHLTLSWPSAAFLVPVVELAIIVHGQDASCQQDAMDDAKVGNNFPPSSYLASWGTPSLDLLDLKQSNFCSGTTYYKAIEGCFYEDTYGKHMPVYME